MWQNTIEVLKFFEFSNVQTLNFQNFKFHIFEIVNVVLVCLKGHYHLNFCINDFFYYMSPLKIKSVIF